MNRLRMLFKVCSGRMAVDFSNGSFDARKTHERQRAGGLVLQLALNATKISSLQRGSFFKFEEATGS
jgi:hypothetical protein